MRLIDADALKEALLSETRDKFEFVCLSRVPQDYCVKNIKRYFDDNAWR